MKNKLIFLKGLPGSGKSTWALEQVKNEGYKRVSKDDLRLMVDSGKWSRDNETMIKDTEQTIAMNYLTEGYSVIVDDTNFIYEDFWKQTAERCKVDFEVKFFDTPVMECIERDAKRGDKSVGSKVIMGMYEKYLKPKPIPHDPRLKDCYICDIDGTIAIMKDRSPYEWNKVGFDTLNNDVALVVKLLAKNKEVIFLSGRDSCCENLTRTWLNENGFSCNDKLFMRPEGDMRKDTIIKKELYENHVKGKYNVLGVFDDRSQVVQLWRSLGLTCFQVDYGMF